MLGYIYGQTGVVQISGVFLLYSLSKQMLTLFTLVSNTVFVHTRHYSQQTK